MSNFFLKDSKRERFVDKPNANNNLIGIEVKEVITIKDGVKTIKTETRQIDYTRKINETAKILKANNSDIIAKMNKLIEMEGAMNNGN